MKPVASSWLPVFVLAAIVAISKLPFALSGKAKRE
jgi:hypothetical protein